MTGLDADALIARYQLEPMPREGGFFRRLWHGEQGQGRPVGSSIVVLLDSRQGHFSAVHRLPIAEVWHFYLGEPLQMILLAPDGSLELPVLGPEVMAGHTVQLPVPAGTWMGARLKVSRGWSLFGCTMAPGFIWEDYEPADLDALVRDYPAAAPELVRYALAAREPS